MAVVVTRDKPIVFRGSRDWDEGSKDKVKKRKKEGHLVTNNVQDDESPALAKKKKNWSLADGVVLGGRVVWARAP